MGPADLEGPARSLASFELQQSRASLVCAFVCRVEDGSSVESQSDQCYTNLLGRGLPS